MQLFCQCRDYSLPGSSVHEILQARILEWVAISFSRGFSQLRNPTSISCISCIAAGAAKSLQSCPTLCDPIDGSPPGSTVPGILQARTLEQVAISFSSAWKWKVKVKLLSCVRLFVTPWTAAYQAPPPMGFSRQGYWSGMPLIFLSLCIYLFWIFHTNVITQYVPFFILLLSLLMFSVFIRL